MLMMKGNSEYNGMVRVLLQLPSAVWVKLHDFESEVSDYSEAIGSLLIE